MFTLPPSIEDSASVDARSRILAAAAALLATGGRAALTTRAVALAAGVQAPTIYRLFGDKHGLLDAVAEQAMRDYVADKSRTAPDPDALADFRQGWDRHVAFGLAHPAIFAIISGDPRPGQVSPAAAAGQVALQRKIRQLAAAGLLRVSEERAVWLTHAACVGAVLALLAMPADTRDPALATVAREAVVAAITQSVASAGAPGAPAAAIMLRASLDDAAMLTAGERLLMGELLDRIVRQK